MPAPFLPPLAHFPAGYACTELLARPGALPLLLAASRRSPRLAAALSTVTESDTPVWPERLPSGDAAALLHAACSPGVQPAGQVPQLQRQRQRQQLLALRTLARCAEASVVNCAALAGAGAGPALGELAAGVGDGAGRELRLAVAQ